MATDKKRLTATTPDGILTRTTAAAYQRAPECSAVGCGSVNIIIPPRRRFLSA